MNITDELRKEARGFGRYVYTAPQADCLTAIADRIDAEHEAACAEAYGNGVMSVPIALDESAWVELPKDADGVTIHVGDTLDGYNETTVVKRLTLDDDGWFMTCENGLWIDFTAFTHHHESTVEEVMQEMLEQAVGYSDAHTTVALNAIAEYSAKLRLAGDAE